MNAFNFICVKSAVEACSLLSEYGHDAAVLAGGTDLLLGLRRPSARGPKLLIDISRVPELAGLEDTGKSILLKPLATHGDLLCSQELRRFAPLLVSAAATIGAPQIRSRGTVGGNLMNAAPCADTVPPLLALEATVALTSKAGTRGLPLADLFLKPYQTSARPDELLTGIFFNKLPRTARSAFIKLGRRNALAISRLSVAVILDFGKDGAITEARIVPGAAFPTWKRVGPAEQMLLGEKPSAKLFAAVGRKVSAEMIKETGRRWSTEYKEPVLAVLVRRALEQCSSRTAQPNLREVLECASPLALSQKRLEKRQRTGAVQDAGANFGAPGALCTITATINGRSRTLTVPANRTLLELLRDHLGLSGTKCGCEIGECGACTVLLDGQPVNSCLVLAPQINGREVLTVEGLATNGKLHPLQEAFLDHDAVHCGFCTPGMLMSAKALLAWNPRPSDKQVRTAISGNLCRCTGYQQIVESIRARV